MVGLILVALLSGVSHAHDPECALALRLADKRKLALKALFESAGPPRSEEKPEITFTRTLDFDGLVVFSIRVATAGPPKTYLVSVDERDRVTVEVEREVANP